MFCVYLRISACFGADKHQINTKPDIRKTAWNWSLLHECGRHGHKKEPLWISPLGFFFGYLRKRLGSLDF